ncbi:hypothetical protein Dimus_031567 [Dionaea muscipula]
MLNFKCKDILRHREKHQADYKYYICDRLKLKPTFTLKNYGVDVHQSRISCDRPSQWLHRHVHVNDNTVMWFSLPHAYEHLIHKYAFHHQTQNTQPSSYTMAEEDKQ